MERSGVQIDEMTAADYDDGTKLWRNTEGIGLDADTDTRERIAAYLARNPGLSYVARSGGQVVGAVLCGHGTESNSLVSEPLLRPPQ